jgi:hypothetical protein
MKSSREGRLGLNSKTNFQWKGRTFSQVSSIIQKNEGLSGPIKKETFFRAMPIKGYRKEIAIFSSNDPLKSSSRIQSIRGTMETPGGQITHSTNTDCQGHINTLDIHYDESKSAKACSSCDLSLKKNLPESYRTSEYVHSLSAEDNARRRVRSAGMARPRFSQTNPTRMDRYMSSSEYMHSRNKTFTQNQFNNIRVGDQNAVPGAGTTTQHVYASNTIQHCGTDSNGKSSYVPVYYKPSNAKYANQGAVDAGARLVRLKYDTITDGSNRLRQAFGPLVNNALSYGVAPNGYTVKDKYGYPNTCTPVISANGTITKQTCK